MFVYFKFLCIYFRSVDRWVQSTVQAVQLLVLMEEES